MVAAGASMTSESTLRTMKGASVVSASTFAGALRGTAEPFVGRSGSGAAVGHTFGFTQMTVSRGGGRSVPNTPRGKGGSVRPSAARKQHC